MPSHILKTWIIDCVLTLLNFSVKKEIHCNPVHVSATPFFFFAEKGENYLPAYFSYINTDRLVIENRIYKTQQKRNTISVSTCVSLEKCRNCHKNQLSIGTKSKTNGKHQPCVFLLWKSLVSGQWVSSVGKAVCRTKLTTWVQAQDPTVEGKNQLLKIILYHLYFHPTQSPLPQCRSHSYFMWVGVLLAYMSCAMYICPRRWNRIGHGIPWDWN